MDFSFIERKPRAIRLDALVPLLRTRRFRKSPRSGQQRTLERLLLLPYLLPTDISGSFGNLKPGIVLVKTATGTGPMPEYRIFLLKEDGGSAKPSVFITCTNDQEAVDKARQIANGLDVEIWEGSRNIVRGNPPKWT
jgi:hypothetical protein